MESQIKRYVPSKVELEGLDRIISKNKELEELIKDEESNLERIIQTIDGIKNINNNMKTIMKQFFIALQQTSMTSDIYINMQIFRIKSRLKIYLRGRRNIRKL